MNLSVKRQLVAKAIADLRIDPSGWHGPAHWARVRVNGLIVAKEEGADRDVVEWFALLHDVKRQNEYEDPNHGLRAAYWLKHDIGRELLELSTRQFDWLLEACEGHSGGGTAAPVTVQACWDADRLDLLRVGVEPNPRYLCTETAKRTDVLDGANRRALAWVHASRTVVKVQPSRTTQPSRNRP